MASLATECAGDQDAWWEFHDYYFEGPGRDAYTRDGAIAVAAEFGLDTDQFAQCIDDGGASRPDLRAAHGCGLAGSVEHAGGAGQRGARADVAEALIELVKELAEG